MAKKKIVPKKKVERKKRVFKKPRKGKSTDGMDAYWKKGQIAANKANIGNEWYNLRSKHGRDKIFETPEIMWSAACEYFSTADATPLLESKPMVTSNGGNSGSSITMQDVPHKRPYTMQGLCRFLHVNTGYFRVFKHQNKDEDFKTVIQDIEDVVYQQKFEGAASGFFNANLISRDLGLKEQTDLTTLGKEINPVTTVMKDGKIISGEI